MIEEQNKCSYEGFMVKVAQMSFDTSFETSNECLLRCSARCDTEFRLFLKPFLVFKCISLFCSHPAGWVIAILSCCYGHDYK